MDKKQKMINLHNQRYSYSKIGKLFGISRQRVHSIITGYKSPTTIEYASSRDRVRDSVRKRDGYTCQICRKIWEKGKRRFDVHHLDEKFDGKTHSLSVREVDRNNLDRMITLCHKCHMGLDVSRERMKIGMKRK